LDIVFIRNVLIYFDVPRSRPSSNGRGGAPDRWVLFLGSTETTWNLHDGFARVPCGRAHYYRALNVGPPAAGRRA